LEHFETLDVCNELVDGYHYIILPFHIAIFGFILLVDLFALVKGRLLIQSFLFHLFTAQLIPGLKHPLVIIDFPVACGYPHCFVNVKILNDFSDRLVGHWQRKHIFLFIDVGCLVTCELQ